MVLELGCASGAPIADTIIEANIPYQGVDLTESQIELALKRHAGKSSARFVCAEMLRFIKNQQNKTYGGIISFLSIYHLPRIYHVELFTHIHRVLKEGGYLLFSTPNEAKEKEQESWIKETFFKMSWSNFNPEWYELTLKELGFLLVMKFIDTTEFFGEEEVTVYYLYQKPIHIEPLVVFSGGYSDV